MDKRFEKIYKYLEEKKYRKILKMLKKEDLMVLDDCMRGIVYDELQKFFTNNDCEVSKRLNGIDTSLKDFKTTIDAKDGEINSLKSQISALNGDVQGAKKEVELQVVEINRHKLELDAKEKENTQLSREKDGLLHQIQEKESALIQSTHKLEQMRAEYDDSMEQMQAQCARQLNDKELYYQGELGQRDTQIQEGCAKVQEMELLIQGQNAQILEKNAQIQERDAHIQEMGLQIQAQTSQIQEKDSRIQESDNKFGGFDNFVKPYSGLAEVIMACETTAGLLEHMQPIQTTENIIKFIGLIGAQREFATTVYKCLSSAKMNDKVPLTCDEKNLIKAFNAFYRQAQEIEFDVFIIPDIDADNKFDRTKYQDIERRSDGSFKSVEEVYVPSLMKSDTTILFPTLVKGRK